MSEKPNETQFSLSVRKSVCIFVAAIMYYTMPTSSVIIANILLFLLPLTAAATSPHETCKLVKITVKRLPDLNIPRNGHSAYCLNNEITVFGGHTTNFVLTPTAEYYKDGAWHLMPMA